MAQIYAEAPAKTVSAGNGIEYAYREVGEGGVPLVLLMHFRGNLDNWDPALVDALTQGRRVILPRYSHLLAGLIPDAEIKIYPDAAHGFLFQHHEEFAEDVREFLDRV
ncbi:hypothetical protein [Streptomyces sp. NPDC029004]|uniref:alpha/beta fold hydrolase n=1 Tax=Streptomyces sp. NPDC029004 TaxID=3154490 RepID=UPI0033E6332F